jgi:hypothetical protein
MYGAGGVESLREAGGMKPAILEGGPHDGRLMRLMYFRPYILFAPIGEQRVIYDVAGTDEHGRLLYRFHETLPW